MREAKYDVRRDRILFIDLELTCWEGPAPEGMSREIVEFGIAEVDADDLVITRSTSLLVRPTRSEISEYCTRLTGITAQEVRRRGRPLAEVCSTLRKDWGSASKAWMSWGSDKKAVDRDCGAAGLTNPFSASFHDLGLQASLLAGLNGGMSLSQGLEIAGAERAGREHSGEGDARTLANMWIANARQFRLRMVLSPGILHP